MRLQKGSRHLAYKREKKQSPKSASQDIKNGSNLDEVLQDYIIAVSLHSLIAPEGVLVTRPAHSSIG